MTIHPASVRLVAVRPVGTPSWIRWVGRVLAGSVVALRAVLIYGEAYRLCPPPAGAETEYAVRAYR